MLASMLSVAMFAATTADRRPTVTVQSSRGYEIVIDGKSYFDNGYGAINTLFLRDGRHTVEVYKITNQGLFRQAKRMVSASAFNVRNNDIKINVDFFGKIQIKESFNKKYKNGRDWNDRDDNRYDDRDMERHDRNGRF